MFVALTKVPHPASTTPPRTKTKAILRMRAGFSKLVPAPDDGQPRFCASAVNKCHTGL
jgi:hypothetical protein